MNKSEAIKVIEESFMRPCSTPDYGAKDRTEFLNIEKQKLIELVIDPVKVTAYTDEWVRQYGVFPEEKYEMLVIAGTGTGWLLYSQETNEFSLASGVVEEKLTLVGYASDDALAEWCG